MSKRDRRPARLTNAEVDAKKEPGYYDDGDGLRLRVDANGNKTWILRVTINGVRKNKGLGRHKRGNLSAIRRRAAEIREAAREGKDLLKEEKRGSKEEETFRDAFESYWSQHKEPNLVNRKHKQQWLNTMRDYVFPIIGDRPITEIEPDEVIKILTPLWRRVPETASRVLQRISKIFDYAIVRKKRRDANPCIGIKDVLGPLQKNVQRRKALPWRDVPRFLIDLRTGPATPLVRLCFELVIYTAVRSEEARGASWDEVDLNGLLWTVPAQRTKTKEADLRVPLNAYSVAVFERAQRMCGDSQLCFPSFSGRQLSDNTLSKYCRDQGEPCTPHGFRSSFKDWCAEEAGVPDEVSEAALGHKDANRVRGAYRRTDFLDARRPVMERWAKFCNGDE